MSNLMSRNEFLDIFGRSRSKYGNKIISWNGMWKGVRVNLKFGSRKEAQRGIFLIYLESIGEISSLEFQKAFELIPKFEDERSMTYVSDAYYFDVKKNKWVIEDTKSEATRKLSTYINKRKLVKYQNRELEFLEV